MPFTEHNLKEVFSVLREIEFTDPTSFKRKICTLSTPDLICSRKFLESHCPEAKQLAFRPDSKKILGWHKQQNVLDGVVDTHDYFKLLQYDLTSFDIYPGRGKEVLQDLSVPIPQEYHGQFDLVFDIVSNQVLNIKQCLDSCVDLVRPGGAIIHITPVAMVNQGFYSCSPTLYYDYYGDRGFSDIRVTHHIGTYSVQSCESLASGTRCRGVHEDTFNFVVTFKPAKIYGTYGLVQSKFQRTPDCKREGW